MNEQKMKKLLRTYDVPNASPGKMQETARLAKAALEKARTRQRTGFIQLFKGQIRYVSPFVWLAQALLLGVCAALLFLSRREEYSLAQIKQLFLLLSSAAPLLTLTGVPEIAKSISHNMQEIELSCKHSLQRLMAVRLILIGSADVLVLTVLLVLGNAWYDCDAVRLILYLLVPFNVACAVCLWVIARARNAVANVICAAICALLLAGFLALSSFTALYESTATWLWGIGLLLSGVYLAKMVLQMMTNIKNREVPQWSL